MSTITMTTKTGTSAKGWPKSDPLPEGIEAPEKIAEASAAYKAALERLGTAEEARRAARKASNKAAVNDSHAATKAKKEGTPKPKPEAPVRRAKEQELAGARDKALAEAVELELDYTGAIAEDQESWLDAIKADRLEVGDWLERALDELAEAITADQGLQVLERRLSSWRHDHTAGAQLRARQLHSEGTVWHLNLASVAEAQGRPVARRMQLIKVHARQKAV